jgi:hypothetical protein
MSLIRIAIMLALALTPALAQNPVTAVYPAAVSSDSEMLCWKNGGSTTLSSNINASTLTVPVASAINLCAPGTITIGSERMKICSIVGNTLTICADGRGWDGSTAASHTSGDTVSAFVPAYWLNRMAAEIMAVQGALGIEMTNVLADPNTAGLVVRRANDTTAARTLQGTAGQIVITNPAGDGGNPIFSLPSTVTGVNITGSAGSAGSLTPGATLQYPTLGSLLISQLGSVSGATPGRIAMVMDGVHGRDCSIGGGSTIVFCYQRTIGPIGAAWEVFGGENALRNRVHATDCTSITAVAGNWPKTGDICIELDDNVLYSCQPSSGDSCTSSGDWTAISGDGGGGGDGDVTAAASFGDDNSIIRADGTGKGVQSSDCSIDDSGNLVCDGSITSGGAGNILAVVGGSTVDANETTFQVVDPTADRTVTFLDASGTVVLDAATQTLTNKSLTSPAITTPTVTGAVVGVGTHYYDFPEISAPASPSADIARLYAKTGSTTQLCMKDSAGVETCFGLGGGAARAYLFQFAFGGTNGINGWASTNIYDGWACSVCTFTGGTKVAHGTLNFEDTDGEIAYLRVGRVPTDVDLENITIELEGVSSNTSATGDAVFDVSFACLSAGADLDVEPATLSWGSTETVSATKSTTTALYAMLLDNGGGHDISGTCSPGQLMYAKFEYNDDDSNFTFRLFSGRAYSP